MNTDAKYQQFYNDAIKWLEDVRQHEGTSVVNLMEQASQYVSAAEELSQEEASQFLQGLKRDLNEFYLRYQDQSKHSIWLSSLNESFWQMLMQMTDKSQIEWSGLTSDFEHNGVYCQGDMVGFGIMVCNNCQHSVELIHPSKLTSCSECGYHQFSRFALAP